VDSLLLGGEPTAVSGGLLDAHVDLASMQNILERISDDDSCHALRIMSLDRLSGAAEAANLPSVGMFQESGDRHSNQPFSGILRDTVGQRWWDAALLPGLGSNSSTESFQVFSRAIRSVSLKKCAICWQ